MKQFENVLYSEGPSREGEISIIVASLTHIQIPLQSCMPNCRMPKKLLFWTILNPRLHSNILSFSYLSKKKKKKNSYKNSYEVKLYPVSPVDWDNMVVSRLLQSTNSCMYVLSIGVVLYRMVFSHIFLVSMQCMCI